MKRILSLLLVVTMLMTSLPVGAFAEATPSEATPVETPTEAPTAAPT